MKNNRIIVAVFLFISCTPPGSMQTSSTKQIPAFDKQGHRGCRGLIPENTIAAMLKAIDLGVTTLETDIAITKDKQPILSHEPFFNHEITTKPDGSFVTEAEERSLNIYKMDYERVKNFDVGLKPHPRFPEQQKIKAIKPLLAEMIDSVESYCKNEKYSAPFYNIETKTLPLTDNIYHPAPPEFVDLLMEVIISKNIEERVIIQSFDFRTLQYLHVKYSHIKTAMLIEDYDKRTLEEHLKALGFVPTIYSPAYSLVDSALVKTCHDKGIKVIPWTVNTKEEIERLRSLGVDGIITDYPNLFAN
jgi:glycerophosphoryl diester phosphodiesterase